MKFYDCTPAPNPRRARIFLAEKGVEVEMIQVDLFAGEQLTDDFKSINPRCTVPVLELNDGKRLTENVGIAIYLEELVPDPPLLGRNALERAEVASWNARSEFDGIFAVGEAFRNSTPGMKDRALTGTRNFPQLPELVERGTVRAADYLAVLNGHLETREFIATDRYTMADITALVMVDFAAWIKLPIPEDYTNLQRWHAVVSARPSAKA